MKLSAFGRKFTADAGITSLMDDLGNAMASGEDMIMMGGGNPGHIPEIQQRVQSILAEMASSEADVRRLVGDGVQEQKLDGRSECSCLEFS